MISPMIVLLAGLACAAGGGELFLRGLRRLARGSGLSEALFGATFAAFATSSPELAVALRSAWAGTPELSLGDCIGSNVVNVALILGGALLLGPLHGSRESLRRDMPAALLAVAGVGLLAADGILSRLDGAVLLAGFGTWLTIGIRDAMRSRVRAEAAASSFRPRDFLMAIAGLGLLLLAARLIVSGAQDVAAVLGWPAFVVGALIVAVGTSTPEIVTTLYARWRGADDIGLGTILGSNIFNLLFIVAIAALLHPVSVVGPGPWIGLAGGAVTLAIAYPGSDGRLGRGRATALLACYGLQMAATWWFGA